MESFDVLVVGAGPAGSTVAHDLARRGHSVLVVEEHARVGHPVQCAGLVSQRVLDLSESDAFVRRSVRGASVWSPGLTELSFAAATPRAFVIDRAALDVHLAERAAKGGACFRLATRFDRLLDVTDGFAHVALTDANEGPIETRARLVIGADGVASAVARAFRLRRPVEILPAVEMEFGRSPGDPDRVEVFLGNDLSPGLFGWWIPDGSGGARIGVAVFPGTTTARTYCERLRVQVERRFGAPLTALNGYVVSGIPIGEIPSTVASHVLLVGDAAAQVKPLSGGGIYTGMRCAQLAATTAIEALERNDLSAPRLAAYDRAWRAEFGDEFRRALYLRRILVRLSDAELERLVRSLRDSDLKASIVAFGDIDFPTHLARKLFRQSPSLLRLFPKALGALWGRAGPAGPDLEPGPRRQAT